MKRLFLARCLVYGSLVLCFGTLVAMGRINHPDQNAVTPIASRRLTMLTEESPAKYGTPSPADWHHGIPALEQHMDVHLADATLAQSVSQLAHLTHLNLVCYDARGAGHLSLNLAGVPAWQAMDALARACGGSWQRDGDVFTLQVNSLA